MTRKEYRRFTSKQLEGRRIPAGTPVTITGKSRRRGRIGLAIETARCDACLVQLYITAVAHEDVRLVEQCEPPLPMAEGSAEDSRSFVSYRLVVNRCPVHPHFFSVSIDDDTGGYRVTPSKCCGRWNVVASWPLAQDDWRELATRAERAATENSSAE